MKVSCLTNEGDLVSIKKQMEMLGGYIKSGSDKEWASENINELVNLVLNLEGISIIASKYIESWQRPSYLEKSTRKEKFSYDFIVPPGCPNNMENFAIRLYESYSKLYELISIKNAKELKTDVEDPLVKLKSFDSVRHLLPAGTSTNVICSLNLKDAREMTENLLGHQNKELNNIGNELKKILGYFFPNMKPKMTLFNTRNLGNLSQKFNTSSPDWYVDLFKPFLMNPDLITKSFESQIIDMYGMSLESFSKMMEQREGSVPDIFKTVKISFDCMMDYGAFRDLQRHRRCEKFSELLTIDYGYTIPEEIKGTEFENEYRKTLESVTSYEDEEIYNDQTYFQYMIPLGYLHRSIFQMDLKELYHIIETRTKSEGHNSYKKIVFEMYKLSKSVFPELMEWCRITNQE
jgi:thymidylate synthase ThyX